MRISGIIFAASMLASGAASAADVYGGQSLKDGPATVAVIDKDVNWSGPWIGIVGGLQFNNDVLSYHYEDTCCKTSDSLKIDGLGSQGLFGELQLGYDYRIQNSNVLIGLFGGVGIDNGEFEATIAESSKYGSGSLKISYDQEWAGVLGPRLGVVMGNTLFYGAGGWAFGEIGKVKASASSGGSSVGGDVFPHQDTDLNGYFLELGMEHRFQNAPGLALKIAGRYTDYDALTLFKDGETNERRDCSWSEHLKLDRDDLKAMIGLTYRPFSEERRPLF